MCSSCVAGRQRAKLRLELFEAFGWKCACCGEDHPQFLTLEHITGVQNKKTYQPYAELAKAKAEGWDPAKYELLCISCNWAKGRYGQCPHRSGVTKEMWIESIRKKAEFRSDYDPSINLTKFRFKKGFDGRRPQEATEVIQ